MSAFPAGFRLVFDVTAMYRANGRLEPPGDASGQNSAGQRAILRATGGQPLPDPRIPARASKGGLGGEDNLQDGGVNLPALAPVQDSLGRGLQQLQQSFRVLGGAVALDHDGPVIVPAQA